jgi:renalase
MRILVVGSGIAGLTAARRLSASGHEVTVVDKGRRPGGRMATVTLEGGARADKGAQFFTVRSPELAAALDGWMADGLVQEWCRGFATADGHPRYVVTGGMVELPLHLAAGMEVHQSVHVDAVGPVGGGWQATWAAAHELSGGSWRGDAVVVTAPVPQAATLLGPGIAVPDVRYEATLSLMVALDGPSAVPGPGGVQLTDDPVWSWAGENQAKGVSSVHAVTLHTTAEMATSRWDEEDVVLTSRLLNAAAPWLGGSIVVDARLHRWRYATPVEPLVDRFLEVAPGAYLAGDAFGGPRVEGAFLSGLAVGDRIDSGR